WRRLCDLRRQLSQENGSRLSDVKTDVVSRRNRQRDDALIDRIKIDSNGFGFFLRLIAGLLRATRSRGLACGLSSGGRSVLLLFGLVRLLCVIFLRVFFLWIGQLFFIAFGDKRRRQIASQHNRVDAASRLMRERGHLRKAERRTQICARREV